jgi:hypothetical protein
METFFAVCAPAVHSFCSSCRVLSPPGAPPPGAFASSDGSTVVTPVSVIEWFMNFFEEAVRSHPGCMHGVVHAGEAIYVPHGWWHCALNLAPCIAVTQNFVSKANLHHVLRVLHTRDPCLISGCPRPLRTHIYDDFCAALATARPDLLAEWERAQADLDTEKCEAAQLASLFRGEPALRVRSRTDDFVDGPQNVECSKATRNAFSFGFQLNPT